MLTRISNTMPIYYLAFIILWSTPGYTTPSSSSKALSIKQIDHNHLLFSDISNLYLSKRFSDVVLLVDGEKIHAHRFILSLNSEYFRVLFFGGLKETLDDEVIIKEVPFALFEILLKYIYTRRINLKVLKLTVAFELLNISDYFGTLKLKSSVYDYLQSSIETCNVCLFLTLAQFYQYEDFEAKSLKFIDNNAREVLREGDFHNFSSEALQEVLNRDTFYANELEIFHAVCRWIQFNQNELDRHTKIQVLTAVRYPLMSDKELSEAKESRLVSSDIILDAIQLRNSLSPDKPQFRGQLKLNEDLIYRAKGFPIINCVGCGGNMMQLENPSFINYIEITLWYDPGATIDPRRSYSYYIEVSMDGRNWTLLIDRSNYNCRSHQYLWVNPQIVWYIRFVETNSNTNAAFRVCHVIYSTISRHKLEIDNGLIVPKNEYNVATELYNHAIVIEGEHNYRGKTFLDYYSEDDKFRNSIFTCHRLRMGSIVVHLAQPYILSSMRMLLWGGDKHAYSYIVEASVDGQHWHMIVDKSKKLARSWQVLQFKRMPILYFRITGVYTTAGKEFRCVYFETPSSVISDSDVIEEDRVENTETDTTMADPSSRTPVDVSLQENDETDTESSVQTRVVKPKFRFLRFFK